MIIIVTKNANNDSEVLSAISAMPERYSKMGKQMHEIIIANAPDLTPKLWYGMPAYADKDGNIICFFRGGEKFKERYMTLGFNNYAHLDDGNMWPVAYAVIKLNPADKEKIAALVRKAVSK